MVSVIIRRKSLEPVKNHWKIDIYLPPTLAAKDTPPPPPMGKNS